MGVNLFNRAQVSSRTAQQTENQPVNEGTGSHPFELQRCHSHSSYPVYPTLLPHHLTHWLNESAHISLHMNINIAYFVFFFFRLKTNIFRISNIFFLCPNGLPCSSCEASAFYFRIYGFGKETSLKKGSDRARCEFLWSFWSLTQI